MSLDIVEIGLSRMTDHADFEKLATEILYNEGYYDIIPLPGGSEMGQDATQESFYYDKETNKIVFQFTIQEYFKGKVIKTIERLQSAKVEFNELVIVTRHKISGETQIKIRKDIRTIYRKPLFIIERETIINRLSDFSNGIFHRHFPDIDKQIKTYQNQKSIFSKDTFKPFESTMLTISIAFTFCSNNKSVKNIVFDNLILACVYELNIDNITIEDIISIYVSQIKDKTIQKDQVKATLTRLHSNKLIDIYDSKIKLTTTALNLFESNTIKSNQLTQSLLNDIADIIVDEFDNLSKSTVERIKRNSLAVLADIFQMHGLEIANHFFLEEENYMKICNTEDTIRKAKEQIPDEVGELLISVIAEIFKNPTKEQAATLSNWSKAYLGVKIMNFDPKLKQLQLIQFSKKIFILDTDFVLNCIIQERPSQNFYSNIVETLSNLNCTLIIPKSVLLECIGHAKRAINTFNYFGNSLFSLNDEFVDTMIGNLFVHGYYYKYKGTSSKKSFYNYIENYFDSTEPENFFAELFETYMPFNIQIKDLDSFNISYPQEQFEALQESLIKRLENSSKAKYRNDEQTQELAKTDAKLFLTTYYLNQSENKTNAILGGKAYLLTLSQRFVRCANEVNIKDIVTNNPRTLASILELMGKTNYNPQDFIKSFDNPLFIYAIDQSKSSIETLVKAGIELTDKNLPRLRRDLQKSLHKHIAEYEKTGSTTSNDISRKNETEKYMQLLDEAKKVGYNTIPEVKGLIDIIERKDENQTILLEKLTLQVEQFEILKKELVTVGYGKQKYIERVLKDRIKRKKR